MRAALALPVAVLSACASATPPRAAAGVSGPARRDEALRAHDEDRAVARIAGTAACSGVLVAPAWVLTAAHCVVDVAGAPMVAFAGDDGRTERFASPVARCELHPGAYPGTGACYRAPAAEIHDESDLALLELARPVPASVARPVPVALALPAGYALDGRRVRCVGWREADDADALAPPRRDGWARVVAAGDELFAALPVAGDAARWTRPGDSGGPALADVAGVPTVLGVLTGGANAASPDSVYVRTTHAPNARWLRAVLGW